MLSRISCSRVVQRVSLFALMVCHGFTGVATAGKPEKTTDLINAKAFPSSWQHISADPKIKRDAVWKLDTESDKASPFLICKHKQPSGYLRTKAEYTNYTLRLEFRYPSDPNCNSGILIHAGKDKIWPASIQVQLHRPFAGSIFPLKGAETSNTVMRTEKKLDTKKWHTLRIDSIGTTVSVWINDGKVGEVSGCKPTKGFIALQSEGFEIHFRKMTVENKPAVKKTAGRNLPRSLDVAGAGSIYGSHCCRNVTTCYATPTAQAYCRPCESRPSQPTYWRYDGRKQRYVLLLESSNDRSKDRRVFRSLPAYYTRNGTVFYYVEECDDDRDDRKRNRKDRRRRRKRDDDDDDDD